MIPTQPVPVRCPQCGQQYNARVQSIVDVGVNPAHKEALLRGQLNVANCPQCGARARLGSPLLYHDPEHELALVLVPMELNLRREEQEKLIGTLSNALMDSLPAEKRRFYLLNPRVVLTMQSLLEAILETEGVTREMMDQQAEAVRLLTELVNAVSQDDHLTELVEQNRDKLTYEFFLLLTASLEDAQLAGDELRARRLTKLRDRLIALTGGPAGGLPEPLPADATADDLIRTLLAAEDAAFVEHVAVNRPRFDYAFFQSLTGQIEKSEADGNHDAAAELTDLRERILDAVDVVDRDMQASLQQGANLLRLILESDDPQQAVQDHLEEVDDAFLLVLSANISQAREQKRDDVAEALEGLYAYILARLEQQLPPELQLVNRLLRLIDPDQRAEVMEAESSLVTSDLASLFEQVAQDADESGRKDVAAHARMIRDEIQARLSS